MQRKNLVWGVLALVVLSLVTVLFVVVAAPSSQVRVANVPAEALPLGTKVAPTATAEPTPTITPAPTATAEPTPTPAPTPTPEATMTAIPPTPIPPTPTEIPTPISTATPIPDLGLVPARLRIPAIGVDAGVEHVGKTADGAMDVPKNVWNVAWYEPGYKPGNPGNAVIAGHLDGYNLPAAVFFNLRRLQAGNKIYITDNNGHEKVFEVYESQVINSSADGSILNKIFGPADESHLNLITCNGSWDAKNQNYNQRLIVYAREVKA